MPQSRQHGKRGSSLRQSLRDRTHSGATVPSPQGSSTVAQVSPKAGAGPGASWRRSEKMVESCAAKLLPVLSSGAGLKEKNRPAPLGRGTCATGRRDRRHREKGPAPPGEGAYTGRRTGATRRKICATSRRDRRHQKEDLRHREKEDRRHPQKGPAPQGADLMRTKEES